MLKKILHVIDGISEWVGRIDSFLLLIVIGATFYEVIVRYFFHNPTSWSNELCSIIFAIYIMLGGAYIYSHKAHICMDILSSHYSPRVKALVDILTYFLAFSFLFVMTWKGGERMIQTIATNEHSTTVWAPSMIPFRSALPVGCALFLLQTLAQLVRNFLVLIKGEAYLDY